LGFILVSAPLQASFQSARLARSGVGITAAGLFLAPASSSASPKGSALGAKVQRADPAGVRRRRFRRAAGAATCTTSDPESFVGIAGLGDVAGGSESAVAGGSANEACGDESFIGAGFNNTAYLNSFIGAGFHNFETGEDSFVGAGDYNAAGAAGAFVGAGGEAFYSAQRYAPVAPGNLAAGEDSFVGAGDLNAVTGAGSFIGAGGSSVAATGATAPTNTISAADSFIGAGDSNTVAGNEAFVGGGVNNGIGAQATYAAIAGGEGNEADGSLSFVGAGLSNWVRAPGSFIGAGGYLSSTSTGLTNVITGADSFIGSGDSNTVFPNDAFIGGGLSNNIGSQATYAAIAGGSTNSVSSEFGAIAGGYHNTASGSAAAVGGGSSSSATGRYATIPGGYLNAAGGTGSFAAGTQAKARHNGTFVWSDNAGTAAVQSTADYQFVARASGGFELFSNATSTSGVKLNPGSGAWSNLSDRTMKTDVAPLDDAAILDKVAALPVSVWSYTSEHGVRHVGPMAQDFYAAFRVGEDDRHITSIDEDGVALAAIKALHAENLRLRQRLVRDEAQRRRDDGRLSTLEREVESLATR